MSDALDPTRSDSDANRNVTRIEHAGKEIHLLGTAHVSRQSVDEVRRVVAALRPD